MDNFFYNLNDKLNAIRETPETTHKQLNERDMSRAAKGYEKYGKEGMEALAKAGREGKALDPVRNRYDKYDNTEVDEGMGDMARKVGGMAKKVGSAALNKLGHGDDAEMMRDLQRKMGVPQTGKKPEQKTTEAAKYRDPKYKDKLYTVEPLDYTYGPDADELYYNPKPDDYEGRKRKIGGSEFDHNDPLRKGFGRSGTGSPVEKGPRKGLPLRSQVSSLKGSIKAAQGTHAEPNLPEAGASMTPKQKSFAKLAPPANKITFADKIAGAKKEVDEMLGDVAAEAIKGALSGGQKKLDRNQNGKLDATDFEMLRKGVKKEVGEMGHESHQSRTTMKHIPNASPALKKASKDIKPGVAGYRDRADMLRAGGVKGGPGVDEDSADNAFTAHKRPRVDAPKVGSVTRGHKHDIEQTATGRKVTRRVDDQGNSVGADDASDAQPQARGRGRPAGTGSKMGAKGPSGKSKLMTKENDFDPAEKGEYDQEGDMAKDSIKTVVRHAQALEKILGDNDNLPEWVQSKLAKIESMMTAVDDYMQNQEGGDEEMAMGEESTNKRDSHAERAGRKVAKDIEYDEKKKDGTHGKKRGSEDDKAEKAGKKVAKDIEYDEKKDSKEDKPKKVKEQGGADTPTASSGFSYGKGIYDSINRELENMIAESMSVNMSDSTEGGKSLTITATDEDAMKLAVMLKSAGLGGGEPMSQEMGQEQSCPTCGMGDCGCGDVQEAVDENNPDYPTDQTGTEDSMMYSGGMNGPKSTGQTTVPVIANQDSRMGDEELRRMMEMAGIQQDNLKPWERTMKEDTEEMEEPAPEEVEESQETEELDEEKTCSACDCDPCECDESVTESFEQMLSRMRNIAGIQEAKKPDFLDMDKDGDKEEPMAKAVDDKEEKEEEKIEESLMKEFSKFNI